MAQWVKEHAAKSNDPSLIPRTHIVKRINSDYPLAGWTGHFLDSCRSLQV